MRKSHQQFGGLFFEYMNFIYLFIYFTSGENKTVEPIQEEEYELPEASAPPPRPSKTEPMPPIPSEGQPPEIPPPRPSKGQPSAPSVPPVPSARPVPQQDDMYEVAEPNAPDNTSDLPPPPPPVSVEENYEVADTQAPAPPPMRPPKRPQPQIPQPPVIPPVESRKLIICPLI